MTRISCLCAAALSRVFFCSSSSSSRVDIHPPHYYYINIVRRIVTVGTHIVCHLVYTPLGVLRVEQKAGIHPSSGCIVLRQKIGPAHTSGSLAISCDARLFFSFFFFFSLKWILFSLLHLSPSQLSIRTYKRRPRLGPSLDIPAGTTTNRSPRRRVLSLSLSLSFVYCPQSSCHPHNQKLRVYCQPNKQGALASTIYSGHVRANAVFEVNSGSCAATVDPRFPISSAVAPPRSQFPFDLWVAFHYV